jgi:dsRNA-specific ribonuclease
MDMENLEILGDCFLKLTVSMSLYHRYPLAGAGALTVEKSKQISNGNLYRIAVQKKLRNYLNVTRVTFRGVDANWIPPGYIPNDELQLKRYMNQKVKRKAFADMMEGFMGAFLVATNYTITIQFMNWLGLDVIPFDEKSNRLLL